jgi:glycolate oxidase
VTTDMRPVSETAIERAKTLLSERLGLSSVLTDPGVCEPYCRDESEAIGELPCAVALARSAADIQAALGVARDTGVPVTPRTGGTGKVGGCVLTSPGMVLDVSPMNQIKDIDPKQGIAVVEPGVKLVALQAAVEELGWFYPPDPNSLEDCALGGNVATNAAGPRAFKYGATRDYVLGLNIHLINGEQMHIGKRTRKGVTGYDVTSLMVGSEGTLGVVSEITLKLLPKPAHTLSLMVLFQHLVAATAAVSYITSSGVLPRCIELFDTTTLAALRAAGNSIDERAGAMLLIELDGDEDACLLQAERVSDACEKGSCLDVMVAQSANQRERVWAARRTLSTAIRKLSAFKMSEDVVVGSPSMPELCARIERSAQQQRVRWLAYGHAGDGNLHVNFLWDDPDDRPRVDAAIVQLFRDTIDLRGTLTGEHGVGILKAPFLGFEQSPELIALQRQLKALFDPKELLNPGKLFPKLGHGNC